MLKIKSLLALTLCLLINGSDVLADDDRFAPLFGFALEGEPITLQQLEKVSQKTGLVPRLVVFFMQWPADPKMVNFPAKSFNAIRQQGAIPCLTWEPMYYQDNQEMIIPAADILEGHYDGYLASFAKHAKNWGAPFIIRFAHEMNITRYHWGMSRAEQYGPGAPELYQQLFRYVVKHFHRAGADNVLWSFTPNAESLPNPAYDATAAWNKARYYYPGDAYVDIMGIDGYNWGTTQTVAKNGWQSQWRSFAETFSNMYHEMKALAPDKPLIIFETASANQGGNKAHWIKETLATVQDWQLDGIVWFQADKEIDWRINSDQTLPLPMAGQFLTEIDPWLRRVKQQRLK